MSKKNKQEREAAAKSDAAVATMTNGDPGANFKFEEGRPLPKDFVNPKPGEQHHRCVDLGNRYRADWFALILYRVDAQETDVQFFGGGHVSRKGSHREKYRLRRAIWCDVPAFIETECRTTTEDIVEMVSTGNNPDNLGLTTAALVPKVISTKKKFHYEAIKSS